MHDTRVYRSAVMDFKSKDHHLVASTVNLKLKFRKGNYFGETMMLVDSRMRIWEKFWKTDGTILEKQFVKLLMVF